MPRINILKDGAVVNTIVATSEAAEALHPGAWRLAEQQDEPVESRTARHISVGAFFDRFGPLKWAILADTNPQVQAVVKDASVRSYIDLDNADLPAGLALIQAAGHALDAAAIIDAPVGAGELP